MNKSNSITNLIAATLKVMAEVKGIDKTLNVGTGQNTYKGVADQEVKKVIGDAMEKNGLAIFPIDIEETATIESWEESYNGQAKRKQSVFTKVKTTYLLTHVSGEFMQVVGYGHGVDSQDKSAGKATTYALKYALLYIFMVSTGKIDDADTVHSIAIEVPATQTKEVKKATPQPLPPDLDAKLVECITLIENAKTTAELVEVFNSNPLLQPNEIFSKSLSDQKRKIQKTNLIPQLV